MHSIYRGRCAVALVHVTATDPLCAGRHPDLVDPAVIADRGAGGVRAVAALSSQGNGESGPQGLPPPA